MKTLEMAALRDAAVEDPPTANGTAPAAAPKLEVEDKLRIENRYLRMQNLKLQVDLLDAQKKEAGLLLLKLQEEMKQDATDLQKKYGVPMLEGTQLRPDGTIVPKARA
jgi:hypothetical protein